MASDIASVVDDGAKRRVVPVVGEGPLQNLIDLKYLHDIDLAIVQSDALDYAREHRLVPNLDALTYVAALYNEQFYLLVRSDIGRIADLAGRTVNIDATGSGAAITATRLFGLLGVKPKFATDDRQLALEKLRKGEIAAVAFVAAKPAPLLAGVEPADHVHLIGIPLTRGVLASYAPARITAADYPGLVDPAHPVETVAIGNVLMAADLHTIPERHRNLVNFIDAFFARFQDLLGPGHEKLWREVNIAADVPGWPRQPAAAEWLRRNAPVAVASNPAALKVLFSRFLDEHRRASGGAPVSAADRDRISGQFQSRQRGEAR
jgi:TRAP-type uncharacterized transport system substrate-binding protein